MSWTERMACRSMDPDLFAAPDGPEGERFAKAVCDICPVSETCKDYGKEEPRGVWGGTVPVDRGFPASPRRRKATAA